MLLPQELQYSIPILLALSSTALATFECNHVLAGDATFDLSPLGGPHNVHWIREDTPPTLSNTTFTIDVCKKLPKHKGAEGDDCPSGTRVCGIEYDYNTADGTSMITKVIPIAGNYALNRGKDTLEAHFTRLRNAESHADNEREGVRMVLNGGKYPFDSKSGTPQKAVVEFLCDPDRDGLSGDEPDEREKDEKRRRAEDEDEKDGDGKKDEDKDDGKEKVDDKKDLRFLSYKQEDKEMVLRLEWRTKHACERSAGSPGSNKGSGKHWGFFTWFIIILFLSISAYLVFGSWLNYTRYGARGWDLVPHGDTIRDMPYLMKDFGRKVVGAVQGGGSRGGYAAV